MFNTYMVYHCKRNSLRDVSLVTNTHHEHCLFLYLDKIPHLQLSEQSLCFLRRRPKIRTLRSASETIIIQFPSNDNGGFVERIEDQDLTNVECITLFKQCTFMDYLSQFKSIETRGSFEHPQIHNTMLSNVLYIYGFHSVMCREIRKFRHLQLSGQSVCFLSRRPKVRPLPSASETIIVHLDWN